MVGVATRSLIIDNDTTNRHRKIVQETAGLPVLSSVFFIVHSQLSIVHCSELSDLRHSHAYAALFAPAGGLYYARVAAIGGADHGERPYCVQFAGKTAHQNGVGRHYR